VILWQDADDEMLPKRVELQVDAVLEHPQAIVGCKFRRVPEGSTSRYSAWLNGLSHEGLRLQRLREVTLIAPTWAMRREVVQSCGGFQIGKAEDLAFFYKHIEAGKPLFRVDEELLVYRYHDGQASFHVGSQGRSFGVPREVLLQHRVRHLEATVLSQPYWQQFTIWGAGKLGRQLFGALSPECRKNVKGFCDVDEKKIGKPYHHSTLKESRPVVHFREAAAPLLLCVNLGLTGGKFEVQ